MDQESRGTRCNCDANLPIPLSDTGLLTNMTALPVAKLYFGRFKLNGCWLTSHYVVGGLNFDLQSAAFRLGRLQCFGKMFLYHVN